MEMFPKSQVMIVPRGASCSSSEHGLYEGNNKKQFTFQLSDVELSTLSMNLLKINNVTLFDF